MKAKYWETLLDITYKLSRLSPLRIVQNKIFERYDMATEREYVHPPTPDYLIGRIEGIALKSDDLDMVTMTLTDHDGGSYRIIGCIKESTMAFNILGDYGLFQKIAKDDDASDLYRLLFVNKLHQENLNNYLDYYHDNKSNKLFLDLCDKEISNV